MNSLIDIANSALENKYTPIHRVRAIIKNFQASDLADDVEHQEILTQLIKKEIELKLIYKRKQLTFLAVKNGTLGVAGRPSHDRIRSLKEDGVTTIITLLKPEEKEVKALGQLVESLGIKWIWFPLAASNLSLTPEFKAKTNELYLDIIEQLEAGEKIFIHCAAGVHRTGAFTNGLFLKMGFTQEASKENIYQIRPLTALEAIPKHWKWSREVISVNS